MIGQLSDLASKLRDERCSEIKKNKVKKGSEREDFNDTISDDPALKAAHTHRLQEEERAWKRGSRRRQEAMVRLDHRARLSFLFSPVLNEKIEMPRDFNDVLIIHDADDDVSLS